MYDCIWWNLLEGHQIISGPSACYTLVYLSIILIKTDFLRETVSFVSSTVTNCKEVTKTSNIPTDQKDKKNIK